MCKLCYQSIKFKLNSEKATLNLFEFLPEPDKFVFTNINKIQIYSICEREREKKKNMIWFGLKKMKLKNF